MPEAVFDSGGRPRQHTKTERNAEIVKLVLDDGVPPHEVAYRYGIRAPRVSQITRAERRRRGLA